MVGSRHVRLVVVLLLAVPSFAAVRAHAQVTEKAPQTFTPHSGQSGKDVVWVPTPQGTVDRMLDIAGVTAKDHLVDLGSGDGVTVIAAAKRGATAMGVEFNPEMVALAEQRAREAGVSRTATFVRGDLFEADLSKATVVTLFLLPDLNVRLRPKLLELAPGTRVVSNTFGMGDWEPDVRETRAECSSWCSVLMWIVPAKVAGAWRLGTQDLVLEQKYQDLSGTLGAAPIAEGKVKGDTVTFAVGGRTFTGRVDGPVIEGPDWAATRP
jgi:SAM-dependent methyltransferase